MAKTGDIVPQFLSESTSGRQIKVTSTTSSGATAIHTAVSGSDAVDFITIEACNTHSTDVTLTLEWGGTTSPDDHIDLIITRKTGSVTVVSNRMMNGGLTISAYASVADVITIGGDVRQVTL